MGRVPRRPQHTFNIAHKPYQIQPFLIAPVLPGETMKNALLQSRAITDPIVDQITGWWLEYYVFYVKHRDLAGREDFVSMVLEAGHDLSAYDRAANASTYHAGPGIDWTWECLKAVVDEYFRDEGEDHTDHVVDGLPVAKVTGQTWMDSLMPASAFSAGAPDLPDDAEKDRKSVV